MILDLPLMITFSMDRLNVWSMKCQKAVKNVKQNISALLAAKLANINVSISLKN